MLNKIKLADAASTTIAQAAFAPDATVEQQRAFLSMFAKLDKKSAPGRGPQTVFSFKLSQLGTVLDKLKAATKKRIDSYEHNGKLDMTCDIVKDKFRVILCNDMYVGRGDTVTIQIYTLGA